MSNYLYLASRRMEPECALQFIFSYWFHTSRSNALLTYDFIHKDIKSYNESNNNNVLQSLHQDFPTSQMFVDAILTTLSIIKDFNLKNK